MRPRLGSLIRSATWPASRSGTLSVSALPSEGSIIGSTILELK